MDLDAEFKARQIEGFEAAIKEDDRRQYTSAFNAANHYAQAGNLEKARPLLETGIRIRRSPTWSGSSAGSSWRKEHSF